MHHTWSYKFQKSAAFIQPLLTKAGFRPKIFMILGSGFRDILSHWDQCGRISMTSIPGYPVPQVLGHGAEIVMARIRGTDSSIDALVATGRVHLYEGYSTFDVCFPVFFANTLGIKSLILTNAAGGLTPLASTGTLVAISDHLNLTQQNIAASPHPNQPLRFIDMANAYDADWREHVVKKTGILSGVYAGLMGPTFETPAESKMLRSLGADFAGMSTVQETIAARSCAMRVFACSFITNQSGTLGSDHDTVLKSVGSNSKLIQSVLESAACHATTSSP